jgi:predicted RNase H-like nuclease
MLTISSLAYRLASTFGIVTNTQLTAARKFELRRVEDPVDAVMCAYIAYYAHHRRDDMTVYGDFATGYIVTPTLG